LNRFIFVMGLQWCDDKYALLRQVLSRRQTLPAYVNWAKCGMRFDQQRHPTEMGHVDIEAVLTHLAVARKAAASP
jgi:hypothetical protein